MREYFDCPDCGKSTWKPTEGLFTDRDKCVECWKKDKVPDGVHHCKKCGSFAMAGSNLCWRCDRIQDLESDLKDLRSELFEVSTERTTCQTHNRDLKTQVVNLDDQLKGYQEKKDYPFTLKVHGYNGACGEAYLEKVLKAAQIVPHVFIVEYSRR